MHPTFRKILLSLTVAVGLAGTAATQAAPIVQPDALPTAQPGASLVQTVQYAPSYDGYGRPGFYRPGSYRPGSYRDDGYWRWRRHEEWRRWHHWHQW